MDRETQIKKIDLPTDKEAGIELSQDFERFNQINDIFSRAFWDEAVRNELSDAFFESHRVQPLGKRTPGFRQKDFALRNAAWALSDTFSNRGADKGNREGFQSWMENDSLVAKEKLAIDDIESFPQSLKRLPSCLAPILLELHQLIIDGITLKKLTR